MSISRRTIFTRMCFTIRPSRSGCAARKRKIESAFCVNSESRVQRAGNRCDACGHDGHTAILMGVAEILTDMRKELKGAVVFIFQPAEEGVLKGEEGGAELMVKQGVLDNREVDVISVDPIVASAQIINGLETIVSRNVNITQNPAVVTLGAIHGGIRNNIIYLQPGSPDCGKNCRSSRRNSCVRLYEIVLTANYSYYSGTNLGGIPSLSPDNPIQSTAGRV